MEKRRFWVGKNEINVTFENEFIYDIVKVCNIGESTYLLASNHIIYHGTKIRKNSMHFVQSDIYANDIASNSKHLFIIEKTGSVARFNRDLEQKEEIPFNVETRTCVHGKSEAEQMKIKYISVNNSGCLFVTDKGQLWALGEMPQLKISCLEPKRVPFFKNRFVCKAILGQNFAATLVRKHNLESDTDLSDVSVASCHECAPSSSFAGSLSSLTDLSNKFKETEESETSTSDADECANTKNIIFRNTEVAREFLTRQFSWMSAGEDYLVEYTEGSTRLIKENVSNVANLVYEGVKTVGDKVVTLSRQVSGVGSDDALGSLDDIYSEGFRQIMVNLQTNKFDELPWSSSTGTSEKDISDKVLRETSTLITKTGNNFLQDPKNTLVFPFIPKG